MWNLNQRHSSHKYKLIFEDWVELIWDQFINPNDSFSKFQMNKMYLFNFKCVSLFRFEVTCANFYHAVF